MATINKAALGNRVLQRLGVLYAGEVAATADTTLVEETIDAVYAEASKLGLVPFAISAIPEWAQVPLRDWVAPDLIAHFGVTGELAADIRAAGAAARERLTAQLAAKRNGAPTQADYF